MSMGSSVFRAVLIAAVLALATGPAGAVFAQARSKCFFITAWEGWKSPSPTVLYLKVNSDIYRVDLSVGVDQLQSPGMHLVSRAKGSSSICKPLDLDLAVADNSGFSTALIAKSLTKLTPEEAAAIPSKYRP